MEIDMQVIEEYLLGELSLEDKIAFEQALSADAALRDKVIRQHAILRAMGEARIRHSAAKLAEAKALLDAETSILIPWRKIGIGFVVAIAVGLALWYFSWPVVQKEPITPPNEQKNIARDTIPTIPKSADSVTITPPIAGQRLNNHQNNLIIKDTIGIYLAEKLKNFPNDIFAGPADDLKSLTDALTIGRTLLEESIANARKTNSVDLRRLSDAVALFNKVLRELKDTEDITEKKLFYRALYYKATALSISDPENAKNLLKQVEANALEQYLRIDAAKDLKTLNGK